MPGFFRRAAALSTLAALLALTGCASMTADRPTQTACRMSVSEDAYLGPTGVYRLVASANGQACAGAPIDIALRSDRGQDVWRFETTADVMFLSQEVMSLADMEEALREWVMPPAPGMTRTIDLPQWRSGRRAPGTGREEFPFYVAEGMTRTRYEALRRASLPMFCPVTGLESMLCVALDERKAGAPVVHEIGYQSFPG